MIASLPMYDRPEIHDAVVRYWQLIHEALRDQGQPSPNSLSPQGESREFWLSPELCLSQTCGLPYRIWLHDKVSLVGTADYALEGCPPGFYRSVIVVRADDRRDSLSEFRAGTLAVNSVFSQSGYAALRNHVKDNTHWPEQQQLLTGSHQASMQAVANGQSDIAAIDAVTWRLAERYEPCVQKLRVLTHTEATPGLPYITAGGNDTQALYIAIQQAVGALSETVRDQLGLRQLVSIDSASYLAVPTPVELTKRP